MTDPRISTFADDGLFVVMDNEGLTGVAVKGTEAVGIAFKGTLRDYVEQDGVLTMERAKEIFTEVCLAGSTICISTDDPPVPLSDWIKRRYYEWGVEAHDDTSEKAMLDTLEKYLIRMATITDHSIKELGSPRKEGDGYAR